MWRDRGFTLVELLVVIAIIGILAGIIFVSAGSTRRDARDKRRKADVEQIAGLFQLRAAQVKLSDSTQWAAANDNSQNAAFLQFLITEGYATQIPRDPINNSTNYYSTQYHVIDEDPCRAPFYSVTARLENTTAPYNNACFPVVGQYIVTGS